MHCRAAPRHIADAVGDCFERRGDNASKHVLTRQYGAAAGNKTIKYEARCEKSNPWATPQPKRWCSGSHLLLWRSWSITSGPAEARWMQPTTMLAGNKRLKILCISAARQHHGARRPGYAPAALVKVGADCVSCSIDDNDSGGSSVGAVSHFDVESHATTQRDAHAAVKEAFGGSRCSHTSHDVAVNSALELHRVRCETGSTEPPRCPQWGEEEFGATL